jgi:hypothetical protein
MPLDNADEQQPLLNENLPVQTPSKTSFALTLSAIMVSAFLAAFDLTVIAAIYRISVVTKLIAVLLIFAAPTEHPGLRQFLVEVDFLLIVLTD